jgi:hypothetical protein
LALTFLVASVAVWRWSERAPFRFLDQGQLDFIGVQPFGGGTLYEEYHFKVPFEPIVAAAKLQIPGPWKVGGYGGSTPGRPRWETHEALIANGTLFCLGPHPLADSVDRYPPVPPGKTGIVRITRRANPLDRFREWYFQRKWKGLRP